jgi:hypothetical protein
LTSVLLPPGRREHLCRVGLVGNADYVQIVFAQKLGYRLIQRHDPVTNIDHEQHQVGRFHRLEDLLLDMVAQPVAVDYPVSAGIDQFEVVVVSADDGAHAVSRNAGRRLDDTNHLPRQRVQKTALAHIGPTNYRNHR